MATYRLDDFADIPHTLTISRAGQDGDGRIRWRYKLAAGNAVIFSGEDLSSPSGTNEDQAARAALGFLTLRPGDTDAGYFGSYSPAQQAWRDAHAEDLSMALITEDGDSASDLGAYRSHARSPGHGGPLELEPPTTDVEFLTACLRLARLLRRLSDQAATWTAGLASLSMPARVLSPLESATGALGEAATAAEAATALEDSLAQAREIAARGLRFTGEGSA